MATIPSLLLLNDSPFQESLISWSAVCILWCSALWQGVRYVHWPYGGLFRSRRMAFSCPSSHPCLYIADYEKLALPAMAPLLFLDWWTLESAGGTMRFHPRVSTALVPGNKNLLYALLSIQTRLLWNPFGKYPTPWFRAPADGHNRGSSWVKVLIQSKLVILIQTRPL